MLTRADEQLLEAAHDARSRAYAPYSDFKVGAALRTSGGLVILGCNVENAAYPATICAERAAVAAAVSAGHTAFEAIAVVGSGDGPTTPCGTCRQVLAEFAIDLRVIAAGTGGDPAVHVLSDLLPHHFGPQRLTP